MKTFISLTASFIFMLTAEGKSADAQIKADKDKPFVKVEVAPFVLGNPDEFVPSGLENLKAKYAHVPVAPFVKGDSTEAPPADLLSVPEVPVAPFILGDPEEEAPIME